MFRNEKALLILKIEEGTIKIYNELAELQWGHHTVWNEQKLERIKIFRSTGS